VIASKGGGEAPGSEDRGNPVATLRGVSHAYGKIKALCGLDMAIPAGKMVGLVGPDGVGKSTLMGLIAGSKRIQSGEIHVLGGNMADPLHRETVCPRIAFMPQGLGKNLYFDLSVYDNIDFFARLFGVPSQERKGRITALLEATGLAPFPDRPAGKLSGGMKQKVSLCSALIHDPDFLILDEPTTGVDPLSRKQFWQLIDAIRKQRPGMSVLVSTAYMDEAQAFDWIIAMDGGQVIAQNTPGHLMEQTGTTDLESAFVSLLPGEKTKGKRDLVIPPRIPSGGPPAIEARDLTKQFGAFVAVNRVDFSIDRGEIFGFLGSNGCGKSTTMKMLVGLIPASSGQALVFGEPVNASDMATRKKVGYMSQAFSLYGELTVRENLDLHARIYDLAPDRARARIEDLVGRFGLGDHLDCGSEALPLGLKQRLSLAVAVLHEPELLLLDEPTSGVDPVARDEFWELLVDLSRNQGVTLFVSTHFMNEALRCDRISLMHAGTVLACGPPRDLVAQAGATTLEEAFIDCIARAEEARSPSKKETAPPDSSSRFSTSHSPSVKPEGLVGWDGGLGRMFAYARRETLEILRDPVRLVFAFLGSALMMLAFGFGITTDVENIRFAYLDLDETPESRAYLAAFEGSRYFVKQEPSWSHQDLFDRLKANKIEVAMEIPNGFGRTLVKGGQVDVSVWVDGSNPNRAENLNQYTAGVHQNFLEDRARQETSPRSLRTELVIQPRFVYNPTFESVYAIVPSVPAILLVLIPAILMAVSIVREKELGSIINFFVTPTRRWEFLVGKQLPYVTIGMTNFVLLGLMADGVFGVSLKGNGAMLAFCAFLYVVTTTSIGMVISSFTSSQVAAVFVTTIVTILPTTQFSGMLQPVSTLVGNARIFGTLWPTTYYMHASVGAFTKGLGANLLLWDALALAAFIPILIGYSIWALPRQEA